VHDTAQIIVKNIQWSPNILSNGGCNASIGICRRVSRLVRGNSTEFRVTENSPSAHNYRHRGRASLNKHVHSSQQRRKTTPGVQYRRKVEIPGRAAPPGPTVYCTAAQHRHKLQREEQKSTDPIWAACFLGHGVATLW